MSKVKPVKKVSIGELIETFEDLCLKQDQVSCPVKHTFTPGLYAREIFMPAGTYVVSEVHKTEHQYIVSKGKVSVFTENDGEIMIIAPYHGVTLPGTKRVLYIHEDTIWTTFHTAFYGETVDQIGKRIIEPQINSKANPIVKEIE